MERLFLKKGLPMKRYVVRRLLMAIPLLLAISFVCFCFINLIPSNPAEVALRVQQMPVITAHPADPRDHGGDHCCDGRAAWSE